MKETYASYNVKCFCKLYLELETFYLIQQWQNFKSPRLIMKFTEFFKFLMRI